MTETDVKDLRELGYSDLDVLHITLGSSQYSYLNRVANGVGIRFEYKTDLPEFKVALDGSAGEPSPTSFQAENGTLGKSVAWIHFPEVAYPERQMGEPRNLFKALGHNVPARDELRKWREYQLRGTSALGAKKRAQIGLYVSGLNRCEYSAHWFTQKLGALGISESQRHQLAAGKLLGDSSPLDRLIFQHADRLTRRSWTTTESDIQSLREAGMDDHGILQLTMLCSYLSFENRVAAALGLALEKQSDELADHAPSETSL
jgi:alkylhydroperoxidase family enzyme